MASVPAAAAACGGTERYPPSERGADGRAPLAIGDSVMLGAVSQLRGAGFEVDVRGCRMFAEALPLLAVRRGAGTLPGVVVIALGTNWTITIPQVRRVLIAVGRDRVLGLVTPREVGGARSSDQAVVRRAGDRWPRRVKVLDWVRYSSGHSNWFWADGLHLQPRGARALTRLLRPALRWPPPDYEAQAPGPAVAASGISISGWPWTRLGLSELSARDEASE